MSTRTEPLNVFISYAHKDEELCKRLLAHLRQMQRDSIINPWHDRQIIAGQEWAGKIDENLEAADIILLLISSDFLNSDYCNDIEMRRALERHEKGEARVIPIILCPCDWATASFGKLEALPKGDQPITTSKDEDEALLDVARGIRKVAKELRGETSFISLPFRSQFPSQPRRTISDIAVLAAIGLFIAFCFWKSQKYLERGTQFLDIGRYAEAQAAFQSAQWLLPFRPATTLGIEKTSLAELKSDPVRFEHQLRALYQQSSDDPHVNMLMGDLSLYRKDREEALSFYQKAVKLRPELAEAHFALGRLFDRDGNRKEAKHHYEKAAEISSTTSKYRNNLADLLFREGDYDEAINQYGRNDHYPLSALEISKIYWTKGNLALARDKQRQAIAWLESEQIAAEPQNQGPWEFEISRNEGVRLSTLQEKRCYAYSTLLVSLSLLGQEAEAEDIHKKTHSFCGTVEVDVKDIIRYDLARMEAMNSVYTAKTMAYRERFLK